MFGTIRVPSGMTAWSRGMPSPLQALVGVTLAFVLLTLALAVAGTVMGRAPGGLDYDGSPVTSVLGVWAVFGFVLLAAVLLLIRHPLSWLTLVVLFMFELLTSNFDVGGTFRQAVMIAILLLPGTRNYYWRSGQRSGV